MNKNLLIITTVESLVLVYATLINLFGIIFFYQYFENNIFLAMVPFGICHLAYALFVHTSTQIAGKLGTRNVLFIAMILFIATAPITYELNQTNNIVFLILWFAVYYLAKLFFHPAMIYLLGNATSHQQRGVQMGIRNIILMAARVLTPIAGGFISANYGFFGIVLLSAFLILLTIIPVTYLHNEHFTVNSHLGNYVKNPKIRKLWFLNGLFEMQLCGDTIWPIFVFLIFSSSFVALGDLVGITAGVTAIAMLLIGQYLDKHERITTLRKTFFINSVVWLSRALSFTPVFTALSDLASRFTKDLSIETLDTVNYDIMNDQVKPQNRDEVVVVREVGINIAISLGSFLVGAIAQYAGIQAGLLFSAIIGFSVLIVRR